MPRPLGATAIPTIDLGRVAYDYSLTDRGFIADLLMQPLPVGVDHGTYPVMPIEAMLQNPGDTTRAPGTGGKFIDFEYGTNDFTTKEHMLSFKLDDALEDLYGGFINFERHGTKLLVDWLKTEHELNVAADLFNPSIITNTSAVGTAWSVVASATPKEDLDAVRETHEDNFGIVLNEMTVSKTVMRNLTKCKAMTDALLYTKTYALETDQGKYNAVKDYLGLEKINVGRAQYNSSGKRKPVTLTRVWNNNYALLSASVSNPLSFEMPSLGRTFIWTKRSGAGNFYLKTEMYCIEEKMANVIRMRNYYNHNFINADAGYLLSNIT